MKLSGAAQSTVTVKQKTTILQKLSLAWTILSVLFSIGFMVFGIVSKWGDTRIIIVLIAIIAAYILIFSLFIFLSFKHDKKMLLLKSSGDINSIDNKEKERLEKQYAKNNKKVVRRMADLKSGLSILKAVMNILYIVMTMAVMASAWGMRDIHSVFAWIVIALSLLLAALSLVFKLATLILKKVVLPRIAKKGTYTVYHVIDGKIQEKKKLNNVLKKLTDKYKKEE